MVVKESIIDKEKMISALNQLLESNNRLPKRLIRERIESLKNL